MLSALGLIAGLVVGWVACAAAQGPCGKTHPYVGFTQALTMMEHNVAGTVTVLDDCTFEVRNFRYDGAAPAAYWWGADSVNDFETKGFKVNSQRVTTAADGIETVMVKLDPGVTWDRVKALSLWCTDFQADFGHVTLGPGPSMLPPVSEPLDEPAAFPPPATEPLDPTAAAATPLANCVPLTGKYYVRWQLAQDGDDLAASPAAATKVVMALEGKAGPGYWMGFGFNDPSLTQVQMPGSDVVVAGMVGSGCFATDYYLQSRQQCNYASGADVGVCPDAGQAKNASANNVKLRSCSYVDGISRIEFERPLAASDRFDWAWPTGKAQFTTWAMGPLSDGSTAAVPVVLFHIINGEPILAPSDFMLDLGQPQSLCAMPIEGTAATQKAGKVGTIVGATTFDVTTGPNPNYPNPPAWGLSYHVNGMESPVLMVQRGTTYTFNVMASPSHPLYITNSATGGAGRVNNASEVAYAGGADSAGTVAKPYVLTWTPDSATPDELYYQCHTHQKLGWKIMVVNSSTKAATVSQMAAPATEAAPAPAPAPEG